MASEEQNNLLREEISLQEKLNEFKKEYVEAVKLLQSEEAIISPEQLEAAEDAIINYENLSASLAKVAEKINNLKAAQDKLTSSADSLAGKLGGLLNLQKDFNETLTSSITTSLGSAEGFAKLQASMSKTFSAANIGAMVIEEVITQSLELTKAQDSAAASFAQSGGNIRLYKGEMLALERSLFTAGVTSDEAAEAFLSINRIFTDLRHVSSSARRDIVETTAILQELGISSDITADNIQFMTKVLGTSAEQAAHTQRELFQLARTIDMPPDAMASAFKDAMPALSAFGSESTEVFKKLQVNARSAGMEVSDVLSIVEKFDTFDTAAQSVGRLNAILGGSYLNSIQMVTTTDPTERMRLLSDAVNSAGLAFDDMSYYQRRALADAMGMDIPQLALLMRDGFEQAVPTAQMSQAELANLAEEAKEFQTVMDELKQTGMLLAQSLMPLVTILKNTLNVFQSIITASPDLQKVFPALVVGVGGLAVAFSGLTASVYPILAVFAPLAVLMVALTDASAPLKLAIGGVSVAIGVLTIALGAANGATGGLIFAIGMIASGLVTIASIIWHKAASPGMIDSLDSLGTGFDNLSSDLGGTASAFGSLKGEMVNTAKAAHKLDGTKVEMQTKMTASTSGMTAGGASTAIRTARDSAQASSAAYMNQAQNITSDVNVSVKADDKSLIKLVVKATEEVINYKDSGINPNANVIANKVMV